MTKKDTLVSIVTPVFNRQAVVERCILSVLGQLPENFEFILVDDASTDASTAVIKRLIHGASNIKLIEKKVNEGVGPARNAGVDASSGKWILFLDSDDEMSKDAVSIIKRTLIDFDGSYDCVGFSCLRDDSCVSPTFTLDGSLPYENYLLFLEKNFGKHRDMMKMTLRESFNKVRYPKDRSIEDLYHLDFAKHFRIKLVAEVARLYHLDATNQLTNTLCRMPAEERTFTKNMIQTLETVIQRHGKSLLTYAPNTLSSYLDRLIVLYTNDYRRQKALGLLLRRSRLRRMPLKLLIRTAIALIDPRLSSKIAIIYRRIRISLINT